MQVQARPESMCSIALLERIAFMRKRNLRQAKFWAGIQDDMF